MAPQERQPDTPLKERLFREFFRFSFFRAVHLTELLSPDKKPLGQTLAPQEEPVRFKVRPGFSFPPSDITNIRPSDGENPVTMEVAFMGLIGPSGLLPHWYNELAEERLRQKDSSLTAFFDIFHHRLITLFYLAWKKYRLSENYLSRTLPDSSGLQCSLPDLSGLRSGGKDRFSNYLLSLTGLGTPGFSGRIGLPEESLLFYSGLLSRPVPSAVAIEAVVSYFSGTTAAVEQFIDRMIPLNPEDQTKLGAANGRLGMDTVCGSGVWENQTKFRISIGPMNYSRFTRFLPTGNMLGPIFSLVRYMVGIEYEFEIRIILKRGDVPPCILGDKSPDAPRLGWSTWVTTPGIVRQDNPAVTFQET